MGGLGDCWGQGSIGWAYRYSGAVLALSRSPSLALVATFPLATWLLAHHTLLAHSSDRAPHIPPSLAMAAAWYHEAHPRAAYADPQT